LVKLSDTDDHQQMNPALRAIAVLNFFENHPGFRQFYVKDFEERNDE